MTQRNGRIIRQGNQNKEVQIYQYVTEGTFDAYIWQTLENKQKFISQIMTSKSPVRACEDVDEQALSYAEVKALCAGNPLIKEKMDLDIEVSRLKVLKADHQSKQYRLEDQILKVFPAQIEQCKSVIQRLETDIQTVQAQAAARLMTSSLPVPPFWPPAKPAKPWRLFTLEPTVVLKWSCPSAPSRTLLRCP